MAEVAEKAKRSRLRYLWDPDPDSPYSQLYIFESLRKKIKEQVKNHLFKLSIMFTLFTNKRFVKTVNTAKPTIIIGLIMMILGIIFHLQGQSVVGPESSFMYSNPEWTAYGLQILIFGVIMMSIGIGLIMIKKFT